MNRTLWIVQWLLALLFLFAGLVKLFTPLQPLVAQTGLSAQLLLFVGVMEVLGGLGMVLPGLLRLWTKLTLAAAVGLIVIMVGATSLTLKSGGGAQALFPLVTGLAAAFVAYGRWRLAPLQ